VVVSILEWKGMEVRGCQRGRDWASCIKT